MDVKELTKFAEINGLTECPFSRVLNEYNTTVMQHKTIKQQVSDSIEDLILALNGGNYSVADNLFAFIKEHGTKTQIAKAEYLISVL